MSPVIAVDAMSGDHGHSVAVGAARIALEQHPDLSLVLVGDEAVLVSALQAAGLAGHSRLRVHPASQVVAMDEAPAKAMRNKKDSSMRVALDLVASGQAQACVSAGNTGALMATARYVLKMLPGIDRPAIMSAMPSLHGHTHMLDLGANSECSAEHLLQFAVMGSVVVSAVTGRDNPSVGLINIGAEAIKGTQTIRRAAELMQASRLNFIGYIEGHDIYIGDVDVVVCDGFTGNVALKTSEGLAHMVGQFLREEFGAGPISRLAGLFALPVLRRFRKRTDPGAYNGASLVGLRGIVVKSHGSATAAGMANAIRIAMAEVDNRVPEKIEARLADWLD